MQPESSAAVVDQEAFRLQESHLLPHGFLGVYAEAELVEDLPEGEIPVLLPDEEIHDGGPRSGGVPRPDRRASGGRPFLSVRPAAAGSAPAVHVRFVAFALQAACVFTMGGSLLL